MNNRPIVTDKSGNQYFVSPPQMISTLDKDVFFQPVVNVREEFFEMIDEEQVTVEEADGQHGWNYDMDNQMLQSEPYTLEEDNYYVPGHGGEWLYFSSSNQTIQAQAATTQFWDKIDQ